MVSQKTLQEYEFETIEQYYDYILLSIINGQQTQATSLAKKLSKEQKKQAILYLEDYDYHSDKADVCKKLILSTF